MSEIRIGVNLEGELAKKFLAVKKKLAINSNADVVRWLINWYFEKEGLTIEEPRFEYFNLDEEQGIIRVHDKKMRVYADIQIIKLREGEPALFCKECQSTTCEHVKFAVTTPKVKRLFKQKKWPLPDPEEVEEWWGWGDLNSRPESPSLLVDWRKLRKDFLVWLDSRDLAFDYRRSIVNYLDRFAPKLSRPLDVVRLFDGLSAGQKHCLLFSLRNLFNFCELAGFDSAFIDGLRKALPKDTRFVDSYVPSEEVVKRSIAKLRRIPWKYKAVYRLLLESGLRLIEAVRLVNSFHELYEKSEKYERFVCVPLFWIRASKKSFYAYFMHETANLLKNNGEKLSADATSKVCRRYGLVAPKYLRKFVFHKMLELEIPEGVADFIQGRAPKTVGERHYANLKRLADKYYPKYAEYLEKLREMI